MQHALSKTSHLAVQSPTHSFQTLQQRPLAQTNEQKDPSRPSLSRICLGMCQRLHLPVTAQACHQRAVICTGTMFFGAATQENAAHTLLNLAAERSVNCFDTAEMYPVPQSAAHQGQSEIVFGNWLQGQRR